MKKALAFMVALQFVVAIVAAFIWGATLLAFVIAPIAALISAVPLLALRTILENQDILMEQLENCRAEIRALRRGVETPNVCTRCGKQLETDWTSCPYCGCRELQTRDTKQGASME